jgi:hypothetical protein
MELHRIETVEYCGGSVYIKRNLKRSMISSTRLLLTCLTLSILTACTFKGIRSESAEISKPKSETLQERIAAEPPANDPAAIAERAANAFINAEGLSGSERLKLIEIYRRTYKEAIEIRSEIGKSKSLLFKMISTTAYNSREVDALKQIIVDLDQRRLIVMFKALADVQAVVGYGTGKEKFYKHFYDFEYPRHENLSSNQ